MNERICERLLELSNAVTQGPDVVRREFTMRVPAEPDRDADLVLSAAADMIAALRAQLAASQAECERRYTHEEVAAWLAEYHGRYREKTMTDWVRDRRAALAAGEG